VVRTVDRLEGLALVGRGTLGDLSFLTPGLLESRPPGGDGAGPSVRSLETSPGRRHLQLSDGVRRFDLEFGIPAPEVVGPSAGVTSAGPNALLVRPPFGEATLEPRADVHPELLVWGNARAQWSEGLPFVEALLQLRRTFGAAPLLWAPRLALPHRVPLLAYLGIDLVDSTAGLLTAAGGGFSYGMLGPTSRPVAREERLCLCPSCAADPPGPLEEHAAWAYRQAIAETRVAARAGGLRELVESRLTSEPALAEMLRYADRVLGPFLEERTSVTGEGTRPYVLREAHRRPEMERFRDRLRTRYAPPPSKSVLLLVPCSRTKPYRLSRSHRRFSRALDGLAPLERVHVVSVSSPIGPVPRELEDVPPARHYDIPVTGEWEEHERAAVTGGIERLLAQGRYRHVVVHLDPHEYAFLRDVLPTGIPVRWTLPDDRTTSRSGLDSLRGAVEGALAGESPVPGGPLAVVREELREVAAFQFGRTTADRLFEPPLRLAGRPWFQRLTDGRNDLATLREERGLFHLTTAGARRLLPDPPLWVAVDPSLPLRGDLFTPGVRGADGAVRVGDSVVLLRDGALAGVGEAILPGRLMTELGHGLAVRVRHRLALATDSPMTDESPLRERGPVV
jgi:archaeosine synthase